MKEYTIIMALLDMIPVAMFTIGSIMLQRDLYYNMSKGAFALFATGTINISCAGFLKALYKLLYAAGICDFEVLSKMFFPTMSIGFLMAGLSMIALIFHKQKEGQNAALAVAPPLFTGTFVFVGCMVVGLLCIYYGLGVLAVKLGKKYLILFMVISFLCMFSMGYLSSQDFTQAYMNWICEAINLLGQGLYLFCALKLRKAGLRNLNLV